MTMIKNKSDKVEPVPKQQKICSSPRFRLCSIPICGVFWFIFLWLFAFPLIFVSLRYFNKPVTKDWPSEWPIYYWLVCFVLFTAPLIILVCWWRINSKPKFTYEYKRSVEDFESLLTNIYQNNESKSCTYKSIVTKPINNDYYDCQTVTVNKKVTKVEEKPRRSLFAEVSLDKDKKVTIVDQSLEEQIEEELEAKKFAANEKEQKIVSITDSNLEQETQKLFPRCSVNLGKRAENSVNRRTLPAKLNLQTKDAEIERETKRFSSPISPRDLFFYDLIQAAQCNMHQTVDKFLETERQNSEGVLPKTDTAPVEDQWPQSQIAQVDDGCSRSRPSSQIDRGTLSPSCKTAATAIFMYINPEDDFRSDDEVFTN